MTKFPKSSWTSGEWFKEAEPPCQSFSLAFLVAVKCIEVGASRSHQVCLLGLLFCWATFDLALCGHNYLFSCECNCNVMARPTASPGWVWRMVWVYLIQHLFPVCLRVGLQCGPPHVWWLVKLFNGATWTFGAFSQRCGSHIFISQIRFTIQRQRSSPENRRAPCYDCAL